MQLRGIILTLGGVALCAVSLAWSGAPDPVVPGKAPALSSPKSAPAVKANPIDQDPLAAPGNPGGSGITEGTVAPAAVPKPVLAEAFIAQAVLRVYLNRPASVFVYNSRGQQVFHVDSRRELETVPLSGVTTGFIYLTVRTAQGEMTKKLVYTGK